MADVNGLFWNSNNGDRRYNADSLSEWLRKFFTTGVFNGEMQVTPVSGMGINVATGYANIQGKVRFFDTATSFTVPTANSTYPRIDTVVVQADYTNRNISLVYVQGTYSGNNPEPQAPVRDTGLYQIVLAQIYVAAGATEITAANITDTRADDTLCGWVTSTVEGVPMSQIVSQMQADFLAWYDRMKDQLSEDAAGHLQAEIDTLTNGKTNYFNIANGTNLDTILTSGVYKSPSSTSAVGTLVNCPVTVPFTLLVTGSGTSTTGCVQTILTDSNIYVRRATSSGFLSWVSFATNDDLTNEVTALVKTINLTMTTDAQGNAFLPVDYKNTAKTGFRQVISINVNGALVYCSSSGLNSAGQLFVHCKQYNEAAYANSPVNLMVTYIQW